MIALVCILSGLLGGLAVAAPLAAPLPRSLQLSRRSLARTANETVVWATQELDRALERYGRRTDLGKRDSGSVSLLNTWGDIFYSVTISVGTPPKDLEVIFDTGSADLWLATAPCTGCTAKTTLYDPDDSATSTNSDTTFEIAYGSGTASGRLVTDTVAISASKRINRLVAAVTASTNILSTNVSGILGAGWRPLANSGATPLLQSLAEEGQLGENVFGLALTRVERLDARGTIEHGGVLDIGALDSSLYTGSINWIQLTGRHSYWTIPLQGVSVDGQILNVSSTAVSIDSGTTLIGGPADDAAAVYDTISSSRSIVMDGDSGYFSFLCNSTISISCAFEGSSYTLSHADFDAGYLDEQGTYCLGAIFAFEAAEDAPRWILGAAFLKNVTRAELDY